MINMDIGEAIAHAKYGKMIARKGWNGNDMFVFMQIPSTISKEIIPKMQSLPELVKAKLLSRDLDINYSNQFALVKDDNSINGWSPSSADAIAEDWFIVK